MNKLIFYTDAMIQASLYGLIFGLPFSKSMVEIFFGSAFTFWIVKRILLGNLRGPTIKTYMPAATKLNLPIYVFMIAALLSICGSVSPQLSFKGLFFKLFEGVMIYFITAEVIDNKTRLNRILMVMLASMLVIAIDGIFQYITGADFIRRYAVQGGHMIAASFYNRNSFAGWLVIMVPLAMGIASRGMHQILMRIATWCLAVLLMVCLFLTQSKGALTAFLFSMALFLFLINKRLILILLAGILAISIFSPNFTHRWIGSITKVADANDIRTRFWKEAMAIIEDFPIFGCGLNTYATVGPYYKVPGGGGCYPHNSYLQMAAETGLLGLGAFLWIIVTLFKTSLANLNKIKNTPYGTITIGLLAGLFGFLIHSFVDVNIYSLQLGNLMWFIMGLIIAVQKIALNDKKRGATL